MAKREGRVEIDAYIYTHSQRYSFLFKKNKKKKTTMKEMEFKQFSRQFYCRSQALSFPSILLLT